MTKKGTVLAIGGGACAPVIEFPHALFMDPKSSLG